MIKKNVAKRKTINVGRLNDDVTYYIISANPNDMFFGKARRTPVYMEDIISKEIGPEGEFSKTKTVGIARAFSPYEKEVLPKKLRQFPAKTFYTDVISTTQLINEFRKETGPIRFIIVNPDEKIEFYSKTALKIAAIGSEYDVVHEMYFNDGMLIENIQNVGCHKEDYEQIMVNETNVEEKTQKKTDYYSTIYSKRKEEPESPRKTQEEKKHRRILNGAQLKEYVEDGEKKIDRVGFLLEEIIREIDKKQKQEQEEQERTL